MLHGLYKKYFSKVDPKLVEEMVAHGSNSADSKGRLYALQVMAREGENFESSRLFHERDRARADRVRRGSYYVINVYPTLDMIKDVRGYMTKSSIPRAITRLARTPCTTSTCTGERTSRAGLPNPKAGEKRGRARSLTGSRQL
jgi:hypothetical protein